MVDFNFENIFWEKQGGFLYKKMDFHHFSTTNIFIIFEDKALVNIPNKYCLSKKFILIYLELSDRSHCLTFWIK